MKLVPVPSGVVLDHVLAVIGQETGLVGLMIDKLREGTTTKALVPSRTEAARVIAFDRGGMCEQESARRWLAKRLNLLANRNQQGGSIIVQDVWVSDVSGLSEDDRRNCFVHQGSAYVVKQLLQEPDFNTSKVLNFSASFELVAGFLPGKQSGTSINAEQHIRDSDFAAIVSRVEEIYLQVYDQESFVLIS